MVGKRFFVVITTLAFSLVASLPGKADETGRIMLNLFGTLAQEVIKQGTRQRNVAPPITSRAQGWCQIWQGQQFVVERQCVVQRRCTGRACINVHYWPGGSRTVIRTKDGIPHQIGSDPVQVVRINGDICAKNLNNGKTMCFASASYLQAKAIPDKQPQPAPVAAKPQAPTTPPPSTNKFDALTSKYADVFNESTSEAKQMRCEIGKELIYKHSKELGKEMAEDIMSKLKEDSCFG